MVVGLPNNSYKGNLAYHEYGVGSRRLCKLQKRYTRLIAQVIKFTSCLPMVGGSLRVLRLLPPLQLVAMI